MLISRMTVLVVAQLCLTPVAHAAMGFDTVYNQMEARLLSACGPNVLCRERLTPFLRFVWENREKRNMKVLLAKCTVQTALTRGYVIRPLRVFNDMSPAGALSVADDVCVCTVGNWAANVCEPLRRPLPL